MLRTTLITFLALALSAGPVAAQSAQQLEQVEPAVNIKVQLSGALNTADLIHTDAGYRYRIYFLDGHTELLCPEQFAQRVYRDQTSRSWIDRVLNITSPIGFLWVSIGLLGQVLFTGRMVLQWLVSERRKRSVVPPMFWWMSLTGASMLVVYFLWRKDIVGVLGQSTGWFIYVRNLWLIHKPKDFHHGDTEGTKND